ncbi:MAG: helix-turn-helix domain-containing protein, partial [Atopobiaceae bacterium]|nr:helix-turn-helix domain-containing protein [Atopobiaceae bacterium]
MAVFRTHKNQNYTVMSNYHLRDRSLSLKAVGLLSKMLSLPDDWDYNLKGLMLLTKDGESSVRSDLKELEEAGYLERHTERVKGRFVTAWDVHEVPVTSDEWVERPAREGEMDNPAFDNPKD